MEATETGQTRCAYCGRYFRPDPRARKAQKSCPNGQCRATRKRESQKRWVEANPDYFKGRYSEVNAWRKKHPDYQRHWRKKIREIQDEIFKKLEKNLPDAGVRVEELRFILNWILEYAIRSSVPNQSIGFVTRSLEAQGQNESKPSQQKGTKYIQIATILRDYEKPSRQIAIPPKTRTAQKEAEPSCILPLVKKIVQKNRGSLKVSADSEGRLGISLILPIERRRVWLEFGSKENKL